MLFFAIYAILLGRWFGLAGAILYGPVLALEQTTHSDRPESFGWIILYSGLRAISMGLAGWFTINFRFGVAFFLFGTMTLVVAFSFVGPFPADVSHWTRPKINSEALVRGAARGLAFGAAAVLSAMLLREPRAIWFAVWVGIVTGISSALFVILSPSVGWWADNLPTRRLGAYGALLVVIGSAIQALQYVLPLLGITIV
ncbi:MAG: hypothetical protein ACLQDV_10140 [Candidatus Binataceae bacterium]